MENRNDWLIDISRGTFSDDHILGSIIGRGSISIVQSCLYKGKKKCACKITYKKFLKKNETRSRIEKLIKLRHDNIISIREAYEDTHRIYMVQDLASGGELLERLATRREYTERDAASALKNILFALDYIHGLGLCHGNIRPEKLLYATENDNSPLLVTYTNLTSKPIVNSSNCYRILYCAPEVSKGQIPSPASDIWSLGVVLYIMLCGFEPFFQTTQNIFPSPYWDDKTDEAKYLITQLLHESPEKRPTAKELLLNSWVMCDDEKTNEHFMIDAIKQLRQFNARRKFRVATLAVRATHRALALTKAGKEEFYQSSSE